MSHELYSLLKIAHWIVRLVMVTFKIVLCIYQNNNNNMLCEDKCVIFFLPDDNVKYHYCTFSNFTNVKKKKKIKQLFSYR